MNATNFKGSRTILSDGDLIGFGCKVNNWHVADPSDTRYYVYRFVYGHPMGDIKQTFDLTSDDEEESEIQPNKIPVSPGESGIFSGSDGHDTDGEEADEDVDIKPDIHSLMRSQREHVEQMMQLIEIKQEVSWMNHEYERQHVEPIIDSTVYELSDDDDDVIPIAEPNSKRKKTEWPLFNPSDSCPTSPKKVIVPEPTIQPPPIHEYPQQILKEKVKNVGFSRGQQLASDMFKPKECLLNEPSTSSKVIIPKNDLKPDAKDVLSKLVTDKNLNQIITDITGWDARWIIDRGFQDTLRFLLPNLKPIENKFDSLAAYQA